MSTAATLSLLDFSRFTGSVSLVLCSVSLAPFSSLYLTLCFASTLKEATTDSFCTSLLLTL